MLTDKKILVTGPSGQIGLPLVQFLAPHNLGSHRLDRSLRVLVVGERLLTVLIGRHQLEQIVSPILYRVVGLLGRSSLARG